MPNQRSKKKAPLTGYFPREKVEAFKARAEEMGLTAKDLIELLIDQELTRTQSIGCAASTAKCLRQRG